MHLPMDTASTSESQSERSLKPSTHILFLTGEAEMLHCHRAFQANRVNAEQCQSADNLFVRLGRASYDALVIDATLPDVDGIAILQRLSEQGASIPVILLVSAEKLQDRLRAFELDADDCLTKPIIPEEFIARLKLRIRRASGLRTQSLRAADLTLDLVTHAVDRGGRHIDLTTREISLLEYFMRSQGRILTRRQICQQVWHMAYEPGDNLVDVTVGRLRRKVDQRNSPRLIETIRGVGYRFRAISCPANDPV